MPVLDDSHALRGSVRIDGAGSRAQGFAKAQMIGGTCSVSSCAKGGAKEWGEFAWTQSRSYPGREKMGCLPQGW